MQVLLIEDNEELMDQLVASLRERGYQCLCAKTLGLARLLLERHQFRVILLDVMLPDGSGIDFLGTIRTLSKAPVIVLTARNIGTDKVRALDLGADDYLTKPFWVEELLARIRAVERRAKPEPQASSLQFFGTMKVHVDELRLEIEGEEVSLTPMQWTLLQRLLLRQDRAVRHDTLASLLGGVGAEALQAQISRLRKRLGDSHGWRIETVWGVGYRFRTKREEGA